jgi:predicted nucleic acid-binding protein
VAGERVVVPAPVAREIERRGSSDVTVRAIRTTPWLERVEAPRAPSLVEAWDLGEGESGVLAWAHAHPGTLAIIDDLAARRCAASLQIPVRGTLGLVLVAKQRGLVPAARPLLDRLRAAGLFLSQRVINDSLALVGE